MWSSLSHSLALTFNALRRSHPLRSYFLSLSVHKYVSYTNGVFVFDEQYCRKCCLHQRHDCGYFMVALIYYGHRLLHNKAEPLNDYFGTKRVYYSRHRSEQLSRILYRVIVIHLQHTSISAANRPNDSRSKREGERLIDKKKKNNTVLKILIKDAQERLWRARELVFLIDRNIKEKEGELASCFYSVV